MKKQLFGTFVFLLLSLAVIAQSITLTESGNDLIYQRGDTYRTLPKKDVRLTYVDPYLTFSYKFETVFRISSHTIVTTPASSSMTDLRGKIVDLLAVQSGGGSIAATETETKIASTVVFWGHSFIEGVGGTSFPTQFGTLSGYNTINNGVGGETSTQIKARFDADSSMRDMPQVFMMSRNDISQGVPNSTIKANMAAMIAKLGHNRYVVIGDVNRSTEPIGNAAYTQIMALNADWQAQYGANYMDIRAYQLTKGTGAGQDAIDVSNGVVPTSLRATGDNLHFNTLGYYNMAELTYTTKKSVLLGDIGSKNVSLNTVASLLANARKNFQLGIGNSYQIGGVQAVYVPDQDKMTGTYVFGNGGRRLIYTTGNEGRANTFIGADAGLANTTGSANTIAGANAGKTHTTALGLTLYGYGAGSVTTSGDNSIFGNQAGIKNTSGTGLAYFGGFAGSGSITASGNSAFGHQALQNATAANNSAFGYRALRATLAGAGNTAFGNLAGDGIIAGSKNFAFGNDADVPDPNGSNQGNLGNVIWAAGASGTGTTPAGRISIGVNAPAASATLELAGTTTGLLINRMTTTQRDAIASPGVGLMIINVTTPTAATLEYYNGTTWKTVTTN